MTNLTPHGQVPEVLIDLIDAYAETRHRCGGIYNAKTEAARKAVIEALSGVQALSAAPNGWESVIDEARSGLQDSEPSAFDNSGYRAFAETVLDAVEEGLSALAASPTPPAEQPTPDTGHAEADRLIGRLMSSDPDFEDCRQAAVLIQREIKGPDGFGTWREAAIAERLARVNKQAAPKAAPAVDITTAGEMQAFEAWHKQDCVIEGAAAKMAAKAAWKARAMLAAEQQAAPNAAPVCVCGEPQTSGTVHRIDGPCYVAAPNAAPQQEPVSPISVGWGRDYLDNGKPIDASVAPVPNLALAPQQEAQEPVWDGKLSDAMRNALDALYLQCGHEIARDISHQVRKECEAIYTSYTTAKRMYQAARDRLGAIETAQPQPDPFAAPQPATAPLSDDTKRLDWMDKDAGERVFHVGADWYTRPTYGQPYRKHENLRAAIDAAIAAQGGKDAG